MAIRGFLIFAVTYLLISARRLRWLGLDRPAAALLGAVACVAFRVLSPEAAIRAVDGSTLLLLLGVMGMGSFLAVDGFFEQVEQRLIRRARSPGRLLGLLVWGAGLLAALITNDAVCVLGAPLLVRMIARHRLPAVPFLLALATAANTGSVATLVGNPQNMLCGLLGGLAYRDHLILMGPVAIIGLALNHGLLWLLFRRQLAGASMLSVPATAPFSSRVRFSLAVIAGSAVVFLAGGHLAWTAAGGFVLLMVFHRRDTRQLWSHIDWTLLLFFAGLFVVVAGLTQSGASALFFERFPLLPEGTSEPGWLRLSLLFLVGSNLVSNVPFILVIRDQMSALPDPRLGWEILAMASTFAGNLTLLGSVANIIVAEAGREAGGLGYWEYLRLGLPLAILTTLSGLAWVLLIVAGL